MQWLGKTGAPTSARLAFPETFHQGVRQVGKCRQL
jgi:hypothetical protein